MNILFLKILVISVKENFEFETLKTYFNENIFQLLFFFYLPFDVISRNP